MSKILPILFNTEMVQAILDGRKTVTRRAVKPQPKKDQIHKLGVCIAGDKKDIGKFMFGTHEYGGNILHVKIPYQTGDILYVRETWTYHEGAVDGIIYKARCPKKLAEAKKWYPSIHMPKEAARIWLRVTNVRVERLQDMTLNDYLNEGVCLLPEAFNDPDNAYCQAKELFSNIWNATIEKTDIALYGWDANPWVWVIEFERCEKPEKENVKMDKMRKCKGECNIYENGKWDRIEFELGYFHEWGMNYEEFESNAGNYSVAIVELPDGRIVMPAADDIVFLDSTIM